MVFQRFSKRFFALMMPVFLASSLVGQDAFFSVEVPDIMLFKNDVSSELIEQRAQLSWNILRNLFLDFSCHGGRINKKLLLPSSKIYMTAESANQPSSEFLIRTFSDLVAYISKSLGLIDTPLQDGYKDTLLSKALLAGADAGVVVELLNHGASLTDKAVVRSLFISGTVFDCVSDPVKKEQRFIKDKRLKMDVEQIYRAVSQLGISLNDWKNGSLYIVPLLREKYTHACNCFEALQNAVFEQRKALKRLPEVAWNETDWSKWMKTFSVNTSQD